MTTVHALLKNLADRGVRVRLDGERLVCLALPGSFTTDIGSAVNTHRDEIVAIMKRVRARGGRIPRADRHGVIPLSHAQERLWFIDQLDPDSAGYSIAGAVRIAASLDAEVFAVALAKLVQRHEILRTVFASDEGTPRQCIMPRMDVPLAVHDLTDVPPSSRVEACRRLCAAEAGVPFDLTCGPLFRATIFRLGESDHVVLLNMHHIVGDGWSIPILVDELAALMTRGDDALSPLPIQYADYAAWQRNQHGGGTHFNPNLDYWRDTLRGVPETLALPTDGTVPTTATAPGGTHRFRLDALVTAGLSRLARDADATPFMAWIATVAVLLHRYAGQHDFCIGTPVANRGHADTAGLIGLFVNTLPLRMRLQSGVTFHDLLRQVRETCLEAYARQDTPFEQIVAAVATQRNLAATPLFRVMVAMQEETPSLAAWGSEPLTFETGIAKFDLSFDLTTVNGGTDVVVEFNAAMFARSRIERMAKHLAALVAALVARPDVPVAEQDYLGRERHRLLTEFNETDAPIDPAERAHDAIVAQAVRTPAVVALRSAFGDLTYDGLLRAAAITARQIREGGALPGQIVGLCVDRTPAMVSGLLGILLAGCAFLPLDPRHPPGRLAQTLTDAGASLVVADPHGLAWLEGEALPPVIALGAWEDMVEQVAVADGLDALLAALGAGPAPDDLAYVIFTSGSTGRPKGVAVEHRSLVNHNRFACRYYGFANDDVQLMVSSMGFDLYLEEVLVVLRAGGTLVLTDREQVLTPGGIGVLAQQHGLTALNLPTALFHELVSSGSPLPTLRRVIVGGERLDPAKVDAFFKAMPSATLFNTYGPTETTIISTAARLTAEAWNVEAGAPIGRPIDNTHAYVLDAGQRLVPIGVAGELYIGGHGVARGYLGQDELTRERFVSDPFGSGGRLYRTGDLVRWREDGQIDYLGRVDHQVKVRGFRVEPGEIEACIASHPDVSDAMVIAQTQVGGGRLLAFFRRVGTATATAADVATDLKAYLRQRLPDYMLPAACVEVTAWPLTPNGKVDAQALFAVVDRVDAARDDASPMTDTERAIAEVWAELLGLPVTSLSRESHFFEVGGHSLLATRLLARIRQQFDADIGVRAVFSHSLLREMAWLVDQASRTMPVESIPPMPREGSLPLGPAQERLWFLQQLEQDSAAYNVAGAARLRAPLDAQRLHAALLSIAQRHEALRTVFVSVDGEPRQVIRPEARVPLDVVDLSVIPAAERIGEAQRLCLAEASTPFDLVDGPLLRCVLIRLASDDHVLMLNMHHIVSDGWSTGILLSELGALLADPDASLPALPIQYADYAIWQRRWLEEGGGLSRQLDYWTRQLAGMPESLALPTDYPRPAERGSDAASVAFTLDAALVRGLRTQADAQGATLYMALLALVQALLYRYTGQDDICIGTPIANRRHAETEGLIGMFVNTLPLRTRVDGAAGFEALLTETMRTCLDAYEHQDTPFERIVEAVSPQRNRAISPLFQVMVILQNTAAVAMPEGVTPFELAHDVAKFDLSLEFVEEGDGISATITYATDLFQRARIERMVGHLSCLGEAALAAPTQAIGRLDYLPAVERAQVLGVFNAAQRAYPREARIHDFVVAQMARTPERIAVVAEEGSLTYAELDVRSQVLARSLQARGVGPDRIVGLCAERSLAMVVAIVGIVRAGAAYLPLDPDYPSERLAYMLADSEAPVVLTQAHLRERIAPLLEGRDVHLRCLDSEWAAIEADAKDVALADPAAATDLCYVLYTSGSTGLPKGVLTEHRALVNQMHWRLHRYGLSPDDVVLQKTPYSFDVSVWEFFWPLMVGAHLVLAVPGGHRDVAYLDALIDRHGITTLHFVPSMVSMFLEHARGEHPSVKHLFCGGEAMPAAVARGYKAVFPHAHLYNLYGPTEAAIDVTAYECDGDVPVVVPIGRPLDNTRIYILDRHDQPQPLGVAGELFIAGDQLARGYLNRPDLTAERFVADPFVAGERMYRSGDLARWNDDGTIDYLGRIDTQVKLRGQRIELGEIEACLETHESVEKAAVIVQGQGTGQRLVAFYRLAAGAESADEALREHAMRALPAYMVPSLFMALATWPATTSGKTDRRALAAIEVAVASRALRVAPTTDDEQHMVEVWAAVLGVASDQIGIEDDFFDLGGHSLLATRLVARIRHVFGVELPLRDIFTYPLLKDLTACVQKATPSDLLPLRAERGVGDVVLGYAQERLWFLQQLEPASTAYNMPLAARLLRRVDAASVADAIHRLTVRHESLRTVFPLVNGEPKQRVLPDVAIPFVAVDLSARAPGDALAEAQRLCLTEASTPFDLAAGPLLRGLLVTVSEGDHVLMLTMHHIVGDGWSTGILLSELGALLADPDASLPALPIQYADYAIWQRRWLEEGGGLSRQLDYWTRQLAGMPESLALPTDYPRPAERGSDAASVAFTLDAALVRGLRTQADAQGATLYMALLALVQALLYRYTGQDDICIGTPIANRRHAETEGLIGMFVNTLPLRTRVDGAAGFEALLTETMRTCLDAYEHQDTPFERIVEAVSPQRNRAISPLFQVMVILQNTAAVAMPEGVTPFELAHDVAKFDLSLEFVEEGDGISATITYATDLFQRARIERMVGHLSCLGEAALAAPTQAIGRLDYLPAVERAQVLGVFNATQRAYPREARIHDFVVAQMARTPERIAVVAEEGSLTYAELDVRSQVLARSLQARGVGPDRIVGLCAERSLAMVVAIVGIVRAGAAYLPLDPDYPSERLAYMLADSEAPVVLTQAHLRERIAPLLEGRDVHLRCLDSEWAAIEADAKDVALADPAAATDLCYVLYTSGSTGRPKGVLNEHRGLVNRLVWMQRAYALTDADVVLQKTPYSFDVSVWEFFWPLMTGACIAVAEPGGHRDVAYLRRAIDHFGVTTLHFVPSMLTVFLENGHSVHDRVTRLICSGEALGRRAVMTYRERFPQAGLYNLYGPTEAAIDVTAHDCAAVPTTHVPIGAPIDNLRIYILDALNQPQPVGVAGELYIAGDGLARGYLKRPELTAERFVADPFVSGERMYRSGDLARWNDDGTIDYLGRIDTQVKLRGQRIELGEIEACLEAYEGVENAAVVVQGEGGAQRLIAAYHPATDAVVDEDALRAHVAGMLPAYMLPSAFVPVADWPTTTSGKTDRRALADIDVTIAARTDRMPPATDDERHMAALWAEVLDLPVDAIARDDDFFELGGHSLLAVRLMARIEQSWARALPIATLFHAPTLAELVQRLHAAPAQGVLVPIKPASGRLPLFVMPGVGGNVLSFRALAQSLGTEQAVFGLQAAGLDAISAPATAVQQAAAINAEAIRSVQPHGPYRLLGHSFGGVVAFETARLLLAQGEQVESLALLDAFPTVQTADMPRGEAEAFRALCQQIGSLMGRDVDVPADELAAMPTSEWPSVLRARGIEVGTQQLDTLRAVHDANRQAYERYVPSPMGAAIPVTLYRATNEVRPDMPADHGWKAWLPGPLRIVEVAAGHFSMLDEPAATAIAMDWRQTTNPSSYDQD